jgi:hypothetical protein
MGVGLGEISSCLSSSFKIFYYPQDFSKVIISDIPGKKYPLFWQKSHQNYSFQITILLPDSSDADTNVKRKRIPC